MTIKAIETVYNGYRFRSRLEARWAVFFDALRIEYQFEPEGFELSNGTWYLPDFYLPTFSGGMWCEVKPIGGSFNTARQFAIDSHQSVWFCEGIPNLAIYRGVDEPFSDGRLATWCGIPNFDQAIGENRMYGFPCEFSPMCQGICQSYKLIDLGVLPLDCFDEHYIQAVYAARQARFEHGETPRIP